MPRPKPKQSSPTYITTGHQLSDTVRATLLRLLGNPEFDPNNREFDPEAETMRHQFPGYRVMKREPGHPVLLDRDPNASTVPPERDMHLAIRDVEQFLGLYVEAEQHLDNTPRPADYREAFRPICREAKSLLKTLRGWTEYYRDQFKLKGTDIQAIEEALVSLVDVSAAVVRDFAGKSSKGAPRNTALTEVIRQLRYIFRKHYQGKRTNRPRRGAFQSLTEWERRERKFVQTALRAARIIPEKYRELPRLFRDPRCTPSEDRAR